MTTRQEGVILVWLSIIGGSVTAIPTIKTMAAIMSFLGAIMLIMGIIEEFKND